MLQTPTSNMVAQDTPAAAPQSSQAVPAQTGTASTLGFSGGVYDSSPFMDFPPHLTPDLDNSPLDDTLIADYLNTPLITDDDMLTSPSMEYADMALFGGVDILDNNAKEQDAQSVAQELLKQLDMAGLQVISPFTPMLDSFQQFSPYNAPLHSFSAPAPAPVPTVPTTTTAPAESSTTTTSTRRRSQATGIRKGITPDALLDEEAPTQPRKYTTPSTTSRKEVPAVFARKRARSAAFGDEEDELSSPSSMPLNPTEKDLIEMKRRQNTVAARRSRKRKLEQLLSLETRVQELEKERDMWKSRAETYSGMLNTMGHNIPGGDF